jgi:hypothetical protein
LTLHLLRAIADFDAAQVSPLSTPDVLTAVQALLRSLLLAAQRGAPHA